ncbi:hypothetical protein ACFT9I_00110 [Streptomyces sp. NPDC057137]|uniref:hypothetical protein n=1 Tax=Streptomyces sp. NPDC057137 TaxID=3346030 RepID=UPI00362D6CDC
MLVTRAAGPCHTDLHLAEGSAVGATLADARTVVEMAGAGLIRGSAVQREP